MDEQENTIFQKTYGNRVKRLREELTDLSAKEFAAKVEIDPDWYLKIEEGEADAYLTDLYHIACFYDIKVKDFFIGVD